MDSLNGFTFLDVETWPAVSIYVPGPPPRSKKEVEPATRLLKVVGVNTAPTLSPPNLATVKYASFAVTAGGETVDDAKISELPPNASRDCRVVPVA